jgi:diamine N-acetyltransferase
MPDIEFRRLDGESMSSAQLTALTHVVLAAPGYSLAVAGKLPTAEEVPQMFAGLPPGYGPSDQYFHGVYVDERMIGCCDVLRGWKHARQSMIGLLLFDESFQGHGYGTQACRKIEELVRSWEGMESLRIGVIETNVTAFAFWKKMGFIETGERKKADEFIADTIILEKPLC